MFGRPAVWKVVWRLTFVLQHTQGKGWVASCNLVIPTQQPACLLQVAQGHQPVPDFGTLSLLCNCTLPWTPPSQRAQGHQPVPEQEPACAPHLRRQEQGGLSMQSMGSAAQQAPVCQQQGWVAGCAPKRTKMGTACRAKGGAGLGQRRQCASSTLSQDGAPACATHSPPLPFSPAHCLPLLPHPQSRCSSTWPTPPGSPALPRRRSSVPAGTAPASAPCPWRRPPW